MMVVVASLLVTACGTATTSPALPAPPASRPPLGRRHSRISAQHLQQRSAAACGLMVRLRRTTLRQAPPAAVIREPVIR